MTPGEIEIEIEAFERQQEMLDYRTGLICAVIAEPRRDKKEHPKPFTPYDFMPEKEKQKQEPKPAQTPEEMLAIMKELSAALKGR